MTRDDIWTISSILYSRWVEFDQLWKDAQKETDDGSPDWELFHKDRVENSRFASQEALDLFNRFKAEHADTIREMTREMLGGH